MERHGNKEVRSQRSSWTAHATVSIDRRMASQRKVDGARDERRVTIVRGMNEE